MVWELFYTTIILTILSNSECSATGSEPHGFWLEAVVMIQHRECYLFLYVHVSLQLC